LELYGHQAQPGSHRETERDLDNAIADPDFVPVPAPEPMSAPVPADAVGASLPAS